MSIIKTGGLILVKSPTSILSKITCYNTIQLTIIITLNLNLGCPFNLTCNKLARKIGMVRRVNRPPINQALKVASASTAYSPYIMSGSTTKRTIV